MEKLQLLKLTFNYGSGKYCSRFFVVDLQSRFNLLVLRKLVHVLKYRDQFTEEGDRHQRVAKSIRNNSLHLEHCSRAY